MRHSQNEHFLLLDELIDDGVDNVNIGTTDEPQSASTTCGVAE